MLKTTEAKINAVIADYLNGNRADAARAIRGLTKLHIAQLLVEHHQADMGRAFIGRPNERYDFEQFVVRALLNYNM